MWKQKQQSKQNYKISFNTLRIYITVYHTYPLLYCKGHMQIMGNDSTINVETKKNNRVNKVIKLHFIHLEFILQYMTLTRYYFLRTN